MGLLQALRGIGYRATVPDPTSDFWYTPFGGATAAGVPVGPDTALRFSAVYACVRILSEAVANLPIQVFQHLADGGKQPATNHPLYDLLHDEPCRAPRQTAYTFKATAMVHLLLRGNAYAQIVPGPRGPVDQLQLIHPDRVTPIMGPDNNLVYKVRQPDGSQKTLNNEDVFHMLGMSLDGVTGVSVITYAREAVGLGLAAEGYAARVFSQDATPRGVLKHPSRLSQEAIERLRTTWQQQHGGLGNVHKPAILEEGMDWMPISMTANDAQLIAGRQFQVVDIARWFGVPLHMVQETNRSTSWGAGIEQLSLAFVIYTLMTWLRRWEDTIRQQLIMNPRVYFAEFNLDALLRGNTVDRYSAYAIGRNWGWLSPNDVRRRENMNPIQGGDTYMTPLNMVPLGSQPGTPQRQQPMGPDDTVDTGAHSPSTPSAPPPLVPLSPAASLGLPTNGAAHHELEFYKELVRAQADE